MNKATKELVLTGLAMFLLMNLIQSRNNIFGSHSHLLYTVFLTLTLMYIIAWSVVLVRQIRQKSSLFYVLVQKFIWLPIPKGAKRAAVIVACANLVAIGFGIARYPFYDVGMFRWATTFKDRDKTVYRPKYYFWDHGHYKILDLRKEGSFMLADYFGPGFTEEFTFAAAFHQKGKKGNFEFLQHEMQTRGIDTLWVGIHSVNFATQEVKFDPDICNAIRINADSSLYYGPIYIPDYQRMKCHEH